MNFPKKAFMPFVVLGDPDYNTSLSIIKTLVDNGASALELGFAFSDPIADGPTIQKSDKRAIENGITTEKAFQLIKEIRNYTEIPISLMLDYNLIFNYNVENFYKKCNETKVNAVLVPNIPLEENKELIEMSNKYNIHNICLVSPTTTEARMKEIAKVCTGYIYLVSLIGTTGTREKLSDELKNLINLTKKYTNLPKYIGFGISKKEHITQAHNLGADGVIVGSAICKIIEENLENKENMIKKIGEFCTQLVTN